ncbi:MAG: site-2 protease family protein, partial [Candidatus Paceibacterota bacterium]
VVGEASRSGIGYVLSLAAFISVNLAVINLIPIPALDGGRILVVALEALLRRPAPRLAVQILNALGIALIIILMITVTYNDIARLLT